MTVDRTVNRPAGDASESAPDPPRRGCMREMDVPPFDIPSDEKRRRGPGAAVFTDVPVLTCHIGKRSTEYLTGKMLER